ncbi:MAG: flagellin FliC [Gammaproteobacteria bacterium]|nr:flagellin FliC [Gammaproteobacteria bacterium]
MALFINTNVASLGAQRSLATSGAELKTAMERLSSGKKINSAADDAAGFAIAERMTAQIRGLNMATKNANDGLSMLGVIENATNDVTDMLHRMRELAIQATNDTNGAKDREFLQLEVAQLIEEIDRVATKTQYNGQTVLDGTFTSKSIQVGTESGQKVTFDINGIETDAIGTRDANGAITDNTDTTKNDVKSIDISDAAGAQAGLQVITDAIEQVAGDRATYGALQNRLEYTVSNLMNVAEFTTAARSRIEDADFAAESARLAKAQVLQQTGTAMLAQANASSQLALSLIR